MGQSKVVTDLDGTLHHRDGSFSREDCASLRKLEKIGVLRVIATGRSLYSAYRVLDRDMPIDYLVFSSGAGIVEWKKQRIIREHHMKASDVRSAALLLLGMSMDFMVHDPIPENPRFHYFGTGAGNPDFIRRLDYYREFATPANPDDFTFNEACQIVAVERHGTETSSYAHVAERLDSLSVIRTTSPIDGASTWIEIFPSSVSKSIAAEWLRYELNIPENAIMAVGNDYNDLDLLHWAYRSYVVGNAPDELKSRFTAVSSNTQNGFSEAVAHWLETENHSV
jgi:hydroxymethylpyrimidine pyrophosphatase-like HAD family hydrolase